MSEKKKKEEKRLNPFELYKQLIEAPVKTLSTPRKEGGEKKVA